MSDRAPLRPRARVAVCWICDRKLAAGGRRYALITAEDGQEHPAHRQCANREGFEAR